MTAEQMAQMAALHALGKGKLIARSHHDDNWWFFYITSVFIETSGRVRYKCWWQRKGEGDWVHTNDGCSYGDFVLERVESEDNNERPA